MPKLFKKFILIVISSVLFFNSMIIPFSTIHAQGTGFTFGGDQSDEFWGMWSHTWYAEPNPFAWYQKVYDPDTPESEIFGERYTAAQVNWIIWGLISFVANFVPGNPDLTVYCTRGDVDKCVETMAKVLDGIMISPVTDSSVDKDVNLATMFNNNPISGVGYIKYQMSKFTLISEVNAQGFGYNNAGTSIIPLWQMTRNMSYGFMVIAVIILAFMIMFQVKINPQTVITVQAAIPKIVAALILITFSYAIAGFVIDLMYVLIGLLAMLLSTGGLSGMSTTDLFVDMTTRNAFVLMYSYWVHLMGASLMTLGSGAGMGIIMALILFFVILAVLWWSLKIIIMMVKNFALLLITIVTGPFEIMFGTMTQSLGFGTWIKKIISFGVFYPVLILMFFLSFFFLSQGDDPNSASAQALGTVASHTPFQPARNIITNNSWEPPLSFLSVSGTRLIWIMVSLFIFSEITKVAEMVQAFVQGKQWAYGSGISEVEKGVGQTLGKPLSEAGGNVAKGVASSIGTAVGTAIKAAVKGI